MEMHQMLNCIFMAFQVNISNDKWHKDPYRQCWMNICLQMALAQITMAAMSDQSVVQQVVAAALQKAGNNAGLLSALLECGVNQSAKDPARQTPSACYYCLMCVSSSDLLLIVGRMRAPRAHYTESYLHFMAPLSLLRERYQGNKGRRVVFFSESSFI